MSGALEIYLNLLKKLWQATEVERDWLYRWKKSGGGELGFIFWGLGILVLPAVLIAAIGFVVWSWL